MNLRCEDEHPRRGSETVPFRPRQEPHWQLSPHNLFNLTEYIHQSILESQLPHKIVNLLFAITNKHIKLTVLRGC
jgi:hypothetical protein